MKNRLETTSEKIRRLQAMVFEVGWDRVESLKAEIERLKQIEADKLHPTF